MTRRPVSPDDRLRRLAALYGVQTSYVDTEGVRREAAGESLLAVLQSLGAPARGPRDTAAALAAGQRAALDRLVEPVVVAWGGRPPAILLRQPQSEPARDLRWRIDPERPRPGGSRTHRTELDSLPTTAAEQVDGTRYVERRFDLPGTLPPGYHRLHLEIGRRRGESLIISAPRRASTPGAARRRDWGLFAPTYALHSRRSLGIGDFRDLSRLAAWAGRQGASVVGTLPLHPTFLEQAGEISPYAPISRFFLNEIFIAVETVPEFRSSRQARRLAGQPESIRTRDRLTASRLVDYRRVLQVKRRLLEAMSRSLLDGDSERSRSFRNYLRANPIVADYARFRAVGEREGTPWQEWRGRRREGRLLAGDADPQAEAYHAYAQWIAHQQLDRLVRDNAAAGVSLYFDLPLGVDACGYDAYRNRDLFVPGVSAGAPPDGFFTLGQTWGFPPLHPQRLREQHHRYFIDTIRHQLRYARLLRIDHIMALTRLFLVPEGALAADGVYLRYPEEELYAVLCLEARRARAELIGEDLGTVPPEVRERMDRHAVKRMYVLPLEIGDASAPLRAVPEGSLATLNTHDMPPFASFWNGLDIGDRQKLGLLDQPGVARERRHRARAKRALARQLRALGLLDGRATAGRALEACVKLFATSRASLVLLNLEDLWLEHRPQNRPGTRQEQPNWRRRLKLSVEDLVSTRVGRHPVLRALRRLRPAALTRPASPDSRRG